MAKQGGIKDIALGRSDIYRMDPRDLHIKEGWNSRVRDFDPVDAEDIGLARSISEVGVKQPLTVYWDDGRAIVSDGHRRFAATMYAITELGAEIKSVPVQTEERYASEADRIFSQIVRNSGKPLAPIEQAKVFKRLLDLGWTEKDIAIRSGINRAWVVELLELQAAPEAVTSFVKTGKVAATLAMQTLKANKGDGSRAAADLAQAVETAEAAGKSRATAKHLGEKKPSPKAELGILYDSLGISPNPSGTDYVLELSDDQYAKLRVLAGRV